MKTRGADERLMVKGPLEGIQKKTLTERAGQGQAVRGRLPEGEQMEGQEKTRGLV